MLTAGRVGARRTTGEVRPNCCKLSEILPMRPDMAVGLAVLPRRMLSPRQSAFWLGWDRVIQTLIRGGWPPQMGNVG